MNRETKLWAFTQDFKIKLLGNGEHRHFEKIVRKLNLRQTALRPFFIRVNFKQAGIFYAISLVTNDIMCFISQWDGV